LTTLKCHILSLKTVMHNYKFYSIKDEQLDHFTDPAYADDAA